MWEESIALQHDEERNQDNAERDTQRYEHDDNTPTTYERAEWTKEDDGADDEQADYEREDKMGAI